MVLISNCEDDWIGSTFKVAAIELADEQAPRLFLVFTLAAELAAEATFPVAGPGLREELVDGI